jgi:anaerobic selenocysteine-containing dehydrogenase
VDFLRKSIAALRDQGGVYDALSMEAFWALWERHGGWWKASPGLLPPVSKIPLKARSSAGDDGSPGEGEAYRYHLLPFSHPGPDEEITTQRPAWLGGSDLWVELNPETAVEIGVRDGQVVRIISTAGEIEALVRECSTIRPSAVGVPLGWKKRSFGGKDERLGNTLMALIGKAQNEAGHMAYMGLRVNVVPAERPTLDLSFNQACL